MAVSPGEAEASPGVFLRLAEGYVLYGVILRAMTEESQPAVGDPSLGSG